MSSSKNSKNLQSTFIPHKKCTYKPNKPLLQSIIVYVQCIAVITRAKGLWTIFLGNILKQISFQVTSRHVNCPRGVFSNKEFFISRQPSYWKQSENQNLQNRNKLTKYQPWQELGFDNTSYAYKEVGSWNWLPALKSLKPNLFVGNFTGRDEIQFPPSRFTSNVDGGRRYDRFMPPLPE